LSKEQQYKRARFAAVERSGRLTQNGEVWQASSVEPVSLTSCRTVDPGLHVSFGRAVVTSRGSNGERFRASGTTFVAGCLEETSEFVTHVSPGEVLCVGIRLDLEHLSDESLALAETLQKQDTVLTQSQSPLIHNLARHLTSPLPSYSDAAAMELFLEARGLELLATAYLEFLNAPQTVVRQRHLRLAQDARAYIDEHLGLDLTISGISRAVGSSERVLTGAFRQAFDDTVAVYVTRRRLERASQLLREGQSVAEAALAVNYSPNALSAAFKQHFGLSPKSLTTALANRKRPDALKIRSSA